MNGKPSPRTAGDMRAVRADKRRARRLGYDDLLEAAKANAMELIGREVL